MALPRLLLMLAAVLATLCCGCSREPAANACPGAVDPDFVIVLGTPISIEEVPPDDKQIPFDSVFRARYKVVKQVCGPRQPAEIEFLAYDHYGRPAFADFQAVLLYLGQFDGKLVHEKYQFHPVFETEDGGWAGCGDPYAWEPTTGSEAKASPRRFKNAPVFDVGQRSFASKDGIYASPLFELTGSKAKCAGGAGIDDLIAVKRSGVLRARGLFK